jgi:sulfatase maturation enzyme AslB (radical SAM superfamily)
MINKVQISKIGKIQKIDIEKSTGIKYYNDIARVCTIIKDDGAYDNRNDRSPYRMAELFGGNWKDYNNHFIIQVAGCPLKCWYCYIDNLKKDIEMSAQEMVDMFIEFRKDIKQKFNVDLNVFHFMGGAPAIYCEFWPILRETLDKNNLKNIILFSDVIFVETYFYNVKPWNYMDLDNFIVVGCLKGTNKKNFKENTGKDLYSEALSELSNYIKFENFYLTLINYDKNHLDNIYKLIPKSKIDLLKIVDYEVVKRKSKGEINDKRSFNHNY